jgi:hypothetical protein
LTTFGGAVDAEVAEGEDEVGEDEAEVKVGGPAGWFVWTEHARKRRVVVAALVAATIAVWINRLTPGR